MPVIPGHLNQCKGKEKNDFDNVVMGYWFFFYAIMRIMIPGGGGGVLPYMGYIGMCGPKGYGFSAVLVIDRVSILANFGHFGHKWGMVFVL